MSDPHIHFFFAVSACCHLAIKDMNSLTSCTTWLGCQLWCPLTYDHFNVYFQTNFSILSNFVVSAYQGSDVTCTNAMSVH